MPTTPRVWPNNARAARDRSAEEANRVITALQPIVNNQLPAEEVVRRIAIALNATHTIARLLESQGAPTRPPEFKEFIYQDRTC